MTGITTPAPPCSGGSAARSSSRPRSSPKPGPAVEAAFLDALARSELIVEATTAQDFARMADLVRQYADFPLGTADASVIAVAERLGATHVATIDHRHFRAVRPAQCAAFELLPALLPRTPGG
jgi:hypothetical protein